ncbi:MAG: hypothetical protein HY917_02590 [Candidatus Diapherotrites archaeon]|nr:hypothetical protein [Candidatus Diapherotrites archaeon]
MIGFVHYCVKLPLPLGNTICSPPQNPDFCLSPSRLKNSYVIRHQETATQYILCHLPLISHSGKDRGKFPFLNYGGLNAGAESETLSGIKPTQERQPFRVSTRFSSFIKF